MLDQVTHNVLELVLSCISLVFVNWMPFWPPVDKLY